MKITSKLLATKALAVLFGASSAMAADIDVIATQTAMNADYGLVTMDGNQIWTADNTYILTDRLYVAEGQTLTIEPGTKIYSTESDSGTPTDASDDLVGAVIVARGGKIFADGTPDSPIVFDALQTLEAERGVDLNYDTDTIVGPAPTANTNQLWGGIIMLGRAYVARTNGSGINLDDDIIEGFSPTGATDLDSDGTDILEYGADARFSADDNDSSGILRYVSIRHGGYEFGDGNEINGLTLGGVGRDTVISHVEVFANFDDGVEFFGGTVNTDHLVVAFCGDDAFDIDQGHSGTHQFWFAIQDPGTGDNLGEWDGVDGSVKSDADASITASAPQIYNVTFVGPGASSFTNTDVKKDNGLFMDDLFAGSVFNSIIHDSVNFAVSFDSNGANGQGFENNLIGSFGRFVSDDFDVLNGTAPTDFYLDSSDVLQDGNTAANTDPGFSTYTRDGSGILTSIDPRPATGSAALTGPFSTNDAIVPVSYRGAFGEDNWIAGWTSLSERSLTPSEAATDSDSDGVIDAIETVIGTNPNVAETPAALEAAFTAYVASQSSAAAAVAAADATTAAEASFITLGGVEAEISTDGSGNSIINFELKSSDDLIDFGTTVAPFSVGLPSGVRFYRFEEQVPAS